jgi:hypothetical protein
MVPIINIIGRTPAAVERLIGEPEKKEAIVVSGNMPALKTYYQSAKATILYTDNIADWVTIFGVDSMGATDFALTLGIDLTRDELKDGGKMSYLNVCGLSEVIVYTNSDGKIWMLHVKAFTP